MDLILGIHEAQKEGESEVSAGSAAAWEAVAATETAALLCRGCGLQTPCQEEQGGQLHPRAPVSGSAFLWVGHLGGDSCPRGGSVELAEELPSCSQRGSTSSHSHQQREGSQFSLPNTGLGLFC